MLKNKYMNYCTGFPWSRILTVPHGPCACHTATPWRPQCPGGLSAECKPWDEGGRAGPSPASHRGALHGSGPPPVRGAHDQRGFGVALAFTTHGLQEEGPFPYRSHLSRASVQPEASASGGQEGRLGPHQAQAQGPGFGQTRLQTPAPRRAGICSFNVFLTDICAG